MSIPVLRAGIVGWPVSHSRSPLLHGYWLRKYAISGTYERIPIAPENFAVNFRALAGQGHGGGEGVGGGGGGARWGGHVDLLTVVAQPSERRKASPSR